MKSRLKALLLVLVVGGSLAAGGWFVWNRPQVQDWLLSRADVDALAQRTAADPADWRAQYWYGRRLAEAGELPLAETSLRVGLGQNPAYQPALTELGKVLLAQKKTEDAFQVLRMAVGQNPKNAEARAHLALLYRTEGALTRAIEEAQETLRADPRSRLALYELGAAQAQARQVKDAEATFRRAVALYPRDPPLLVGLARVLLQKQQWEPAETSARQALDVAPNDPDVLVVLAEVLSGKPPVEVNRQEALRLLRKAQSIDPARVDTAWNIAEILVADEQWKEAAAELESVVRREPNRTTAYFLLSRAYRKLGRVSEANAAEAAFRRKEAIDRQAIAVGEQIAAQPDNAALRFRMAELHVAAGQIDHAIKFLRAGLERDPKNTAARKRLVELLKRAANR